MKKHNKNKNKANNPDNLDSKNAVSGKENPGKDQPGGNSIAQGKTAEASDVKTDIKKEQTVINKSAAPGSVSIPQGSFKDKPKERLPQESLINNPTNKGNAEETTKDKPKDKEALPSKIDEPIYPAGFYNKKDNNSPVSTVASKSVTASSGSAKGLSGDKSKESVKGKTEDKKKEVLPPKTDAPIYPTGFYKKSEKTATESAEEKTVPKPEKPHKGKAQSGGSSAFTKVILFLIFIGLAGLVGFLLFTKAQHDEAYDKAILELNSQITELGSKQSKLLETIDSQDQKIAAQNGKLESQEQKLETQEQKLKGFQGKADQMADISGKVTAFDEQISAFDDRISSYDYKIKAVSKSVFRTSSAIASLEEKIGDLKTTSIATPEKPEEVEASEVVEKTTEEIAEETAEIPEEEAPVEVEEPAEEVKEAVDETVPVQDAEAKFLSFLETIVEKIGEAGVWVYETSKPHVEKMMD